MRCPKDYSLKWLFSVLYIGLMMFMGRQHMHAAVMVDAQCTTGSITGEWLGTADGRQTFVPTVSGTLFKVRLHTATYGSSTTITVRIFSGAPGSGTMLTNMSYFKPGGTNSWDDVFIPGPGITLTASAPYYIEIATGSQVDWIRTSANVYASGNAWRGGTSYPTYDYNFEAHMAVPTCGAVIAGSNQSGVIANMASAPLGLNGGGDPGIWTTNGTGTFADPRNPGTTYTPGCSEAGSTTTLTWTSSCGLGSTSQTMSVAPPGFTVPNATMCTGGSATLTATGAGTFSWSTGATTASIVVSPGTTTVYTVTGIQGNGCPVSRTPTVTVHPLPVANASNATVCAGNNATLNVNGSGGTPTYIFNWFDAATGGNLLASSPVYNTPVLAPAGTYFFFPQVTDANGCVSTRPTVTVTANSLPPVSVSGGPVACYGGTAALTATGAVTYTWTPGALSGAAQNLPAGSYTITGTSALGCNNITMYSLTQPPAPLVAGFSGANTVCSGTPLNLTLNGSGGTPPYSIQWVAGNNAATTGESTTNVSTSLINDQILNPTAGTQTVTYTISVTDNNLCTASQTVNVTVNPVPVMTSASSGAVCSGTALNFPLANNLGSGSYTWSAVNNPNTTGESVGIQTTPAINNTITLLSAGPETVVYTATPVSLAGCTGSGQPVNITINQLPAISSASGIGICSGSPVNYTITSIPAGNSYSWVAIDNFNTTGESLTAQTTPVITNTLTTALTTPQNVQYTITPTSAAGCAGAPFPFVASVNPMPNMTSPGSATICSGGTVSIPLTSDISSTYNWIATDNVNTTGEALSPQSLTTLGNPITLSTLSPEVVTYTVTPTATAGSCTGPGQVISVTVNPVPVMTNPAFSTVCSGVALNIPLTSNITATYSWIATDNINITGESLAAMPTGLITNTLSSVSSAPENVSYAVTPSALGCAGLTQTVTVTVNPAPTMTSPNAGSICSGVALAFPLSSTVPATYSWLAGDNGNTSGESTSAQSFTSLNDNIASVSSSPENVSYTVTATSGDGCQGPPQIVNISVDPAPLVISNNVLTVCSGAGLNHTLTSNVSSVFSWVAGDHPNTLGEDILAQATSVITNTITSSSAVSEIVSYTITPTSMAGCYGIPQLLSVTVDPAPIITNGGASVCSGSSMSLSITSNIPSTYSWIAANNVNTTGQSLSLQTTPTITDIITVLSGVTELVTYTLTPTTGSGCAGLPQVITVTVNPAPVAVVSGATAFCSGNTFSLNGASSAPGGSSTITGYEWLLNAAPIPAATGVSELFTTGGNYQLVITSSDGCRDTSGIYAVAENVPPVAPAVTFGSTGYCAGDSVLATVTGPVGAHSYSWSVVPAAISLSSPAVPSTYIRGETTGSYTVSVVETDVNGCVSAPASTNIQVNALPVVSVSLPSADTICFNGSVTVGILNTGMAAYSWTTSFGQSSTAAIPGFGFITQPGDIELYATVTDANGCTSLPDTIDVYVVNTPTVNAGSPVTICAGAPVTLTGSGSVTIFSWSGGVTNGVPFFPTVSQTYTVTGTDGHSCTNIATVSVTVNAAPIVNAGGDAFVCAGLPVTLAATGTATSYSWNNGVVDGTAFVPAATQSYVVTGTGANSCTRNDTVIVTVNALPGVGVSASASAVCTGASVSLSGTGANSYVWSGGITDNTAFVPTSTLTYTVTGTDLNGCTNTATQLITVNTLPVVSAGASLTSICPGSTTLLNAGGSAVSYVWSSGQTGASVSVSPSVNTTYTVTGTDANACSSDATVSITLLTQPPTPVASVNPGSACAGISVSFSSSSATDNNWYQVPGLALLSNLQAFTHTEASAGTYSYGLYVHPAGGCSSDTDYVSVTFNSCLTSLTQELESMTANTPVSNNIFGNDGSPAGYTVNTTPVFPPVNGTFTISPSGAYSYTPHPGFSGYDMIVVQACDAFFNCLNDTILIVVSPYAGNDYATVSGLIANSQVTGNVLINDVGSGIGNVTLISNVASGTLTLSANGDFTYTSSLHYCRPDSFRYQVCDVSNLCTIAWGIIDVNCDVTIQAYTGFSPNGDGRNDLWIISNIDFIENKVSVHDRWGNEVWTGTDYDNSSVVWDGRNKSGEELPAGTYFYLIEAKDQPAARGWVEITK